MAVEERGDGVAAEGEFGGWLGLFGGGRGGFEDAGAAEPAGEFARFGSGAVLQFLEAVPKVLATGVDEAFDQVAGGGGGGIGRGGDDEEGEAEADGEDDEGSLQEERGISREEVRACAPGHGVIRKRVGRPVKAAASIALHFGVEGAGPVVDAAAQALDVGVAVGTQPAGGVEGADAVMAVDDEGLAGVCEFAFGFFDEVGEGEKFGAGDVADVPLVDFATVDPAGGAGWEEGGGGLDVDFFGERV